MAERKIAPVVMIYKLGEQPSDVEYWRARTPRHAWMLWKTYGLIFIFHNPMFYPDFKEFIESLNKNKVDYLLVGGYAVALHGLVRTTKDLDIWVRRQAQNAQRLVAALSDFGFESLGLKPADFLEENRIIQLGYEPVRIDIMTDIPGVMFDDCYLRKVILNVDGALIQLISLDDLILNKEASGRPQDQADAARLKKAHKD